MRECEAGQLRDVGEKEGKKTAEQTSSSGGGH